MLKIVYLVLHGTAEAELLDFKTMRVPLLISHQIEIQVNGLLQMRHGDSHQTEIQL